MLVFGLVWSGFRLRCALCIVGGQVSPYMYIALFYGPQQAKYLYKKTNGRITHGGYDAQLVEAMNYFFKHLQREVNRPGKHYILRLFHHALFKLCISNDPDIDCNKWRKSELKYFSKKSRKIYYGEAWDEMSNFLEKESKVLKDMFSWVRASKVGEKECYFHPNLVKIKESYSYNALCEKVQKLDRDVAEIYDRQNDEDCEYKPQKIISPSQRKKDLWKQCGLLSQHMNYLSDE